MSRENSPSLFQKLGRLKKEGLAAASAAMLYTMADRVDRRAVPPEPKEAQFSEVSSATIEPGAEKKLNKSSLIDLFAAVPFEMVEAVVDNAPADEVNDDSEVKDTEAREYDEKLQRIKSLDESIRRSGLGLTLTFNPETNTLSLINNDQKNPANNSLISNQYRIELAPGRKIKVVSEAMFDSDQEIDEGNISGLFDAVTRNSFIRLNVPGATDGDLATIEFLKKNNIPLKQENFNK